eukprot:15419692-Alexandrium_andersonii.AAC.1
MSASLVGSEMCIRDSFSEATRKPLGSPSECPWKPLGTLSKPLDSPRKPCLLYTSDAADDM